MKVIEFQPTAKTRHIVSKFVYLEIPHSPLAFQTIPRIYPAVIFTAPESGDWETTIGNKEYRLHKMNVYFAGLGFLPSEIRLKKNLKAWVIMLKPEAARSIFGDTASYFTNDVFPVSGISDSFQFLNENIWDTALSISEALNCIEVFFMQYNEKARILPTLLLALHNIYSSHGNTNLKALSDNAFTCSRNLSRHFVEHIGVSPKAFSAMFRFCKLVNEFIAFPNTSLHHLAFKYGFYDLSHLNKEAIKFFGKPLSFIRNQDHLINENMM